MRKIILLKNEEFRAKEQMYSLFYEILSHIKGKQLDINEDDYCNIKNKSTSNN